MTTSTWTSDRGGVRQRSIERLHARARAFPGEKMNIGDTAPDFTLPDGTARTGHCPTIKAKPVVLMFYPGDDTPVCTKELCSVRDHWSEYQATGAEVVGISTNSIASHDKFSQKYELPLRLLADEKARSATNTAPNRCSPAARRVRNLLSTRRAESPTKR